MPAGIEQNHRLFKKEGDQSQYRKGGFKERER